MLLMHLCENMAAGRIIIHFVCSLPEFSFFLCAALLFSLSEFASLSIMGNLSMILTNWKKS
jgi:hypothetical protein